jgi:hypothetical protein
MSLSKRFGSFLKAKAKDNAGQAGTAVPPRPGAPQKESPHPEQKKQGERRLPFFHWLKGKEKPKK